MSFINTDFSLSCSQEDIEGKKEFICPDPWDAVTLALREQRRGGLFSRDLNGVNGHRFFYGIFLRIQHKQDVINTYYGLSK